MEVKPATQDVGVRRQLMMQTQNLCIKIDKNDFVCFDESVKYFFFHTENRLKKISLKAM